MRPWTPSTSSWRSSGGIIERAGTRTSGPTLSVTAISARAEQAEVPREASLATYFALTFLLAWVLWISAAAITATASLSTGIRALFFLPGTFAPGIVAIWLTARDQGPSGTRALLGRIFKWQVGARWYVFAVTYLAAVKLGAAIAYRVITGGWPGFGQVPLYLLLAAVVFSTPFQAGEEIGWRGYALPRLASRMGLASGSVVLGIIWALWHLPLFFIAETTTTGQSFPVYLLSVTALSIAFAWLYWRTGGSLLLVMLLHAAANNTRDLVPSATVVASTFALNASPVAWLTVAFLWIAAVHFLFVMREARRLL